MKKLILLIGIAVCFAACKKDNPKPSSPSSRVAVSSGDSIRIILNTIYGSPTDTVWWQTVIYGQDTGGIWGGLATKKQYVWKYHVKTNDTLDLSEMDIANWHWNFINSDSIQCDIWVNGKQVINSKWMSVPNPPAQFHFKD